MRLVFLPFLIYKVCNCNLWKRNFMHKLSLRFYRAPPSIINHAGAQYCFSLTCPGPFMPNVKEQSKHLLSTAIDAYKYLVVSNKIH